LHRHCLDVQLGLENRGSPLLAKGRLYRAGLGKEYFSPLFLEILDALNNAVRESQEVIEGNYFYHHQVSELQNSPDPSRSQKRIFLSKTVNGKKSVLEVGFNAGHSALLILSSNPYVKYVGVDIGEHSYTKEAGRILMNHFGNRFDLIIGDSTDVLPRLKLDELKYEVIHIDGGHSQDQCLSDLNNASNLLIEQSGQILLDDIKGSAILDALEEFKMKFSLISVKYSKSRENMVFKLRNK
jgi:predicted O-methyltransferase YrrM